MIFSNTKSFKSAILQKCDERSDVGANDADIITRKQLIAKLQHKLGDRLVQFDIVGCAKLLCFMDHLSEHLQLVKQHPV